MKITREVFDQQRRPRFGTANPERMQLAFWEWMIRGDDRPPSADEGILGKMGQMMRNGMVKSKYGPWRARDLFKVPVNPEDGPIWTFDRDGRTCTELPDGRVVCVGGEHEDSYDPDFCIYNDVVVLGPANQIEIYGYPKEVFPPTDFHTATLVGDRIIIIGCLGYPDDRRPGHTPVYALDVSEYRITEVDTSGDKPGWLYRHQADFDTQGRVVVRGGQVDGERCCRRNVEEFALDIRSWAWHRLTNRNWHQFSICPEDQGPFVAERWPELEELLPRDIEDTVETSEEEVWPCIRFVARGVSVLVVVEVNYVEVIIEGELPEALAYQIAEEIRANAETAIQRQCVLERL